MSTVRMWGFNVWLRRPWYWFWNAITAVFFDGRAYTLQIPFGHRMYTPWFNTSADDDFARTLRKVRSSGPLIVTPDRCHILFQFAQRCGRIAGDVAECGVYTGGTAQLLAEGLSNLSPPRRLHLFDTFAGMPDDSVPERDYHKPKDFSDTSLRVVQTRLADHASSCVFHCGYMPDTFKEVADIDQYSLVHVDVDIFPSALACCEFFWPRLARGGAMIFDDYGYYPYRFAIHAAVNEYFGKQNEPIITLPTAQALVIKT